MSNTYCRFCEVTVKGVYINCPKCGRYLPPYGSGPAIPPEPYELAEPRTLNKESNMPDATNDNKTVVPAEVVSRICFDYSQSVLRFIADEMAKCERKLDSDDVTKARFIALRDCLDYVERSRWKKPYVIENVSTIEVKELLGEEPNYV